MAEYNPRKMDANTRRRLKTSMTSLGMLQPLVWNRRTGRLVSGHQRLLIMDGRTKKPDYELTVAVVDLDEKKEKEANVALNNPFLHGEFDLDKLGDLVQDGVNAESMGFDLVDLQTLMSDVEGMDDFAGPVLSSQTDLVGVEIQDEIAKIKKIKKDARTQFKEQNSDGFYLVVVFQKDHEANKFLADHGFDPTSRYISGQVLNGMLLGKKSRQRRR